MIVTSERESCQKDYYFGAGDFSYCYDKFEERYLYVDFRVMNTIPGAWEFVKEGKFEGPMMKELRNSFWQDHTDKTFMKSIKQMQIIITLGWDKYANPLLY